MKLATLNIWGGRMQETHAEFFAKYTDVDIWCFQEVYKDAPRGIDDHVQNSEPVRDYRLFEHLQEYLPDYVGLFCPMRLQNYGLAMFVRNTMSIAESGETFIARGNWDPTEYSDDMDHHRKLQWAELIINGKPILVMNTHLTHRPAGKGDSEKRLLQSQSLLDFMKFFSDMPLVLAGDFNLRPNTESIAMIERAGMRNLITEYGITSTRSHMYDANKPVRYADYIFTSPELTVQEFGVFSDTVSDHLAVFVEYNVS